MLILALLAAAVAAPDVKTMGMDDWERLTIAGVDRNESGPYYLDVHAGDLDGDGMPDDAYLKLVCADGKLQNAAYEIKARESGSGMPTGKRMHKPLTVVKEWGAASDELLAARAGYDLKLEKKARMAADPDGWSPLSLSSGDQMCSALAAQRSTVVKSKSNITNNRSE